MGNASRVFKSFASAVKKSDKNLLLAATYGLNTSFTKKIAVGLGLRGGEEFEPLIRLSGNTPDGICLGLSAWTALSNALETISDYFDFDVYADAQWYLDEIELGDDCNIRFTTAHGARAIRFDVQQSSAGCMELRRSAGCATELVSDEEDGKNREDCTPLLKRPKIYRPSIVMQKTTFDGLKTVFVCVDEQVRRLQRLAASVNQCKKQYVEYMVSRIRRFPSKEPSLHTIAQMTKNEYGLVKESIKQQVDPVFSEHYLEIVLLELTRLFSNFIAVEVKQQLEAEPKPKSRVNLHLDLKTSN